MVRAYEAAGEDISLHVCRFGAEWQVWLNTEDADFTGLCVAIGRTRNKAVADAVRNLEAVVEALQQPDRVPA